MSTPRAVLSACVLAVALTAAGCSQQTKPDPLADLTISTEDAREFLVSVELNPNRDLSVDRVRMSVDPGLETEYLGYISRCRELCEIRPWGRDVRETIEASVEGTTPLFVRRDQSDIWVLFRVRVTEEGMDLMERTGCLVVRDVRLRLGGDEEISVRRPLQFLWAFTKPGGRSCADSQLVS